MIFQMTFLITFWLSPIITFRVTLWMTFFLMNIKFFRTPKSQKSNVWSLEVHSSSQNLKRPISICNSGTPATINLTLIIEHYSKIYFCGSKFLCLLILCTLLRKHLICYAIFRPFWQPFFFSVQYIEPKVPGLVIRLLEPQA